MTHFRFKPEATLVRKFFKGNILSGTWTIKALKQRIRIGRFAFCLQEIYGIEQKAEGEEPESECAICWDEERVLKIAE